MDVSIKPPSLLHRLGAFIAFRLIPFVLIVGIIWSGYQVAAAVVRRVNEQIEADQRSLAYVGTATALAPTLVTYTPTETYTVTPSDTPTETRTATSTATLTETVLPSATDTATGIPTTQPDPATATPMAIAQVFATNTPRGSQPIVIPATNTPQPSASPSLEATLTPTEPSAPAITMTPPALPTLLQPADPDPGLVSSTAIPTRVSAVDRHGYDLLNIVLLGGDAEITGDNIARTDTMILLSVNRTAGTVAMLSLPRDLYVYIPSGTMQRLNTAYGIGENIGWTDGGFGLLRQTIFYNLGINVHYYAFINLSGFKEAVDALGGVDIAVDCAIQDPPLVGAEELGDAFIKGENNVYTLPVGYYHFNGSEALWYARSRGNSSDFDRGRRQQQVLRAIWRRARETGQLGQLPELWNQATQLVETNVRFEDMLSVLPIALNLDSSGIEHFTMSRLHHTTPWTTPDGSNVQLPNYENILGLLEDFYAPPTESQVNLEAATIRVFNGTANANWDRVAAERLGWGGFNAVAAGQGERTDYQDTVLIDYTGQTKGSSLREIADILNVRQENILLQPDPNRQADFDVILGGNYNSCTFQVLDTE